jgi:hypothetical protein
MKILLVVESQYDKRTQEKEGTNMQSSESLIKQATQLIACSSCIHRVEHRDAPTTKAFGKSQEQEGRNNW